MPERDRFRRKPSTILDMIRFYTDREYHERSYNNMYSQTHNLADELKALNAYYPYSISYSAMRQMRDQIVQLSVKCWEKKQEYEAQHNLIACDLHGAALLDFIRSSPIFCEAEGKQAKSVPFFWATWSVLLPGFDEEARGGDFDDEERQREVVGALLELRRSDLQGVGGLGRVRRAEVVSEEEREGKRSRRSSRGGQKGEETDPKLQLLTRETLLKEKTEKLWAVLFSPLSYLLEGDVEFASQYMKGQLGLLLPAMLPVLPLQDFQEHFRARMKPMVFAYCVAEFEKVKALELMEH